MEQNQSLQTQPPAEEVVEKKRKAWGTMGVAIHKNELALQVRAQGIEKFLVVPQKTTELPVAELTLKTAKQQLATLIEDRKKITGPLDEVAARLMLPEKSVQQAIDNFSTALIKVKKQAEQEAFAGWQKQQELTQVAEKVRIYVADINAAYMLEHSKLISDSYVYALANIAPANINAYLDKVKARITLAKRTMPPPSFKAVHNTQEAIDAEIAKVFTPITAQEYVDGFVSDLTAKYSDYTLAWDNKDQAIELNTQEAAQNTTAIEQQKQQEVVSANVRSMAAPLTVGAATKELKQVYKLNMEDTFESANIVIQAYLSNNGRCKNELRITKWLTGFGVKQMMGALEKIKNEDNKFHFDGLVWATEDKL